METLIQKIEAVVASNGGVAQWQQVVASLTEQEKRLLDKVLYQAKREKRLMRHLQQDPASGALLHTVRTYAE